MAPLRFWVTLSFAFWVGCIGCSKQAPAISLHQAVESGNLKAVKQHVAAKSDLNKPDAEGNTPLHIASLKGNLAIVEALSAGGADTHRKTKYGRTPLDLARAKNHVSIVQFLEQQGQKTGGGRRLMDGGLGVSDAMDGL